MARKTLLSIDEPHPHMTRNRLELNEFDGELEFTVNPGNSADDGEGTAYLSPTLAAKVGAVLMAWAQENGAT